jgi:hypothetical protein
MKEFFDSHGCDVWYSIFLGYTGSKKPKTASKKEFKRNKKITMNAILDKLSDFVKSKVG